ncbi:MAG: CIA30 family protein, partial [Planctomycetota bacterium]
MGPVVAAFTLLFAANGANPATNEVDLQPTQWRVVLDGVMGGLSSGKLTESKSGLKFTGELSLKNNGGFAWARTRRLDLDRNFDGFEIEVQGDGRIWDFMIDSSRRRVMAGGYRTRFQTKK